MDQKRPWVSGAAGPQDLIGPNRGLQGPAAPNQVVSQVRKHPVTQGSSVFHEDTPFAIPTQSRACFSTDLSRWHPGPLPTTFPRTLVPFECEIRAIGTDTSETLPTGSPAFHPAMPGVFRLHQRCRSSKAGGQAVALRSLFPRSGSGIRHFEESKQPVL